MVPASPALLDAPNSTAQRERRHRILQATVTLASRGGFDAVQMRSVADSADVALGTLYRYFPSKIHLLVAALDSRLGRLAESVVADGIAGDTAEERVVVVLIRGTAGLEREPLLAEALVRAFLFADVSACAELRRVSAQVEDLLVAALASPGEVGPTAEHVALAEVLADIWLSAMTRWITGRLSASHSRERLVRSARLLVRNSA